MKNKTTYWILLTSTILLSIVTINYIRTIISSNFYGEFGFGIALICFIILTIYFIILTTISYKKYKKQEKSSILIFVFGIIPSIFIIATGLKILIEGIIGLLTN